MNNELKNLTIGALARAARVGVETVRFYQRKGLLLKPQKSGGGINRYNNESLSCLKFVKSAQKLDFSLKEISELIALDKNNNCRRVCELTKRKLIHVQKKRSKLNNIEATLMLIIKHCRSNQNNTTRISNNYLSKFKIGELAKIANVSVETVRFYQRKGLLPTPDKPHGSINRYNTKYLLRLKFIKSVKQLDFSLNEIGELLVMENDESSNGTCVLAEKKLKDVRGKHTNLHSVEASLMQIIKHCPTNGDCNINPLFIKNSKWIQESF